MGISLEAVHKLFAGGYSAAQSGGQQMDFHSCPRGKPDGGNREFYDCFSIYVRK